MRTFGGQSRVKLTVWCALCEDEHRRDRGRLGQVETFPGGPVVWYAADTRPRDRRRRGLSTAGQLLSTPLSSAMAPPTELPAVCPHHGSGVLLTSAVTGRFGKISLYLNAAV
jgi:hypothetical protein